MSITFTIPAGADEPQRDRSSGKSPPSRSTSGFVYHWYDRAQNMHYFGSHWGSQDDGYVCSSKWMKDAYKRRPKDFIREILAVVTTSRADLLRREQYWLDRISPKQLGKGVYNLKNKISGHWFVDEGKLKTVGEKIGDGNRGQKRTSEVRAKMSAAQKGKPGHPQTPKTRAQISVSNSGKTHTAETRAAISIAKRGKPLSAAARANMSNSHLGKPLSPEHRKALSSALSGKKRSAEARLSIMFGHRLGRGSMQRVMNVASCEAA
jgi:hypothetical protein